MNKRGQSIIEYSLIAVLVILGVVYMGPYVLRSINAHFKIWDESTQDSFTENIIQAPLNDVPINGIIPNCTCQDSCSCTGTDSDTSQCGGGTDTCVHTCTPSACDGEKNIKCQSDSTCCGAYVDTGVCGTTPIGQNPPNGNCNYGFEIYNQLCGSSTSYECIQNSSCNPKCLGTVDPNATACPGSTGDLLQSWNIPPTVADQSDCPAPATPCQYFCNAGYALNSQGVCTQMDCQAGPLPATVDDSAFGESSTTSTFGAAMPPAGQNYYFFNFTAHGNQTPIILTPGFVTPGQTYHLNMVYPSPWCSSMGWGQDNDWQDNHCLYTTSTITIGRSDTVTIQTPITTIVHGLPEYSCDGDILENNSSILRIQTGDEWPQDQHCFQFQLLDQNSNVVFGWAMTVDYYNDVAFTGKDCCPVTGDAECNGTCTDWKTDTNNCGACGNVCRNDMCINGACCTPTCSNKQCGTSDGCRGTCTPGSGCLEGGCQPLNLLNPTCTVTYNNSEAFSEAFEQCSSECLTYQCVPGRFAGNWSSISTRTGRCP